MKGIYTSPFRVYLLIGIVALLGILSGFDLPISLYPNSSKPTIGVNISYGNLTPSEFVNTYGDRIERALKNISTDNLEVDKVTSEYNKSSSVWYEVNFQWGAQPNIAKREVESAINGLSGSWPKEIRDSVNVNFWSKSSGFIAVSFFSEKRTVKELYDLLEPVVIPKLASVKDAEDPGLFNPNQQEIKITLHPEAMASLGLFPSDIKKALDLSVQSFKGGTVVMGPNKLRIKMPRQVNSAQDLEKVLVSTPSGRLVHLSEVARIDMGLSSNARRIFKTNGSKSLILFANPKSGANVKKMAEDVNKIVDEVMETMPEDVEYRTLVDPSEFIRASVKNVFHEVFLAAGLAVFVLFIFIGSFKNTVTAALEIPLSMVLAFILMNMFDMNLNLISLGGLALAAGMNVDASVVVMENIFRHFENYKGPLNYETRLKIIVTAVKEVMTPIIASTISTLVVFLPLSLTSNLTNAILGDLSKAVVFSHAFSMFIAIFLVPTIRLHLMKNAGEKQKLPKSPIESKLKKLENLYAKSLESFIKSKYIKWISLASLAIALAGLLTFILPNLKREIIGTPDTDWMILGVNMRGNTLMKQMETEAGVYEAKLLDKFGEYVKYTFVQIRGKNRASIMARMHDKKQMDVLWKKMEEEFQNTPTVRFWVVPWNPAELPVPDPPHLRLVVRGGSVKDRNTLSQNVMDSIRKDGLWPRAWGEPDVFRDEEIVIRPHLERWPLMRKKGVQFSPYDLMDLSRVATEGKEIGDVTFDGENYPVQLAFPYNTLSSKESLESFPIGVGEKIIPLKAIADIEIVEGRPQYYREDGRSLVVIKAKQNKGDDKKVDPAIEKTKQIVKDYETKDLSKLGMKTNPKVYMEDAMFELNDALKQLAVAVALSVLLIFLTLLFQFGSFVHTIIIMVAIPLGVFGGTLSLYVFNSTLSLNSVLGIILLNGIAVNNSIILVDFIRSLIAKGLMPIEAAVEAARKRMRPILITSLTTILGMLPVAIGTGEGGKILQPLGLAVTGGLWFSMLFTLFVIPLLEVMYLNRKILKDKTKKNDDDYQKISSDKIETPSNDFPTEGVRQ